MVLCDLVSVQVDVHNLRAFREDITQFREHFGNDVRADDEVGVAFPENRKAVLTEHVPGHSLVEGMTFVHVHLAGVRFPDFGAKQFSHARELLLRTRERHAIADEDHGPLGGRKN
jgi:hypothetical protein